jgi:hypothetical protein
VRVFQINTRRGKLAWWFHLIVFAVILLSSCSCFPSISCVLYINFIKQTYNRHIMSVYFPLCFIYKISPTDF